LLELFFDGRPTWIKQEQLFSSGSYKDRGATVLMSKAKELGIKKVVQDSSGNASCAIAMALSPQKKN
jgi:threonine synthase